MKYKVKLTFKYSDIVHVEAEDESEAEKLALQDCSEQYECHYDTEITPDDDDEQ